MPLPTRYGFRTGLAEKVGKQVLGVVRIQEILGVEKATLVEHALRDADVPLQTILLVIVEPEIEHAYVIQPDVTFAT